jgi:N-carbamoyl-L-amino-acid hydrolase
MSFPIPGQAAGIDAGRLAATLEEYAAIGATPGGGVTRLALSDDDRAARDLLARHLREVGCDVLVDDLGNMRGVLQGAPGYASVHIASHLDTVVRGGRFDGALGVLAGLEILRTLHERDIRPGRTLELVNWTNEEGARFEPAMTGSGGATGAVAASWVQDRRDRDGHRLGDELARIGYLGEQRHRPPIGHACLELHIEQGPVLDDLDRPIGIVEGIVGITWLDVMIAGAAAHAGPTPMVSRRDALVAAAEVVQAVREIGTAGEPPVAGTVGRFEVQPGVVNVIPGAVRMSVDFRAPDEETLHAMVKTLRRTAQEIGARHSVDIDVQQFWTSLPVRFDPGVVERLEAACAAAGIEPVYLWSGAGHDARHTADVMPTGMLFVRSRGGVSHCEQEFSAMEDISIATTVLLHAALALASDGINDATEEDAT